MEIQQIKGFVAVATRGGFSGAAEKTGRTQPAISLQIKALEDELGVKLFDRLGPKKVVPTKEGQVFFEMVSPILENIESLPDRFREACGNVQKGSVKVATHSSVMTYLLPEAVKRFKRKYPDCELSIVNRSRGDIIKMIIDGEADIGITSLQDVPKRMEYRVFGRFKRVLLMPKNHPLSKKSKLILKDLVQYPLIVPTAGGNTRTRIDRVFDENGLKYSIAMEVTGREAVKSFIEMGMGISILNEYFLKKEDKQSLAVRDVSHLFGEAERGVLTRKNRHSTHATREFISELLCGSDK